MEQLEFDCRLESERELEENVNIALEFACKGDPPPAPPAPPAPAKKTYKVGDIVNFHGGTHYYSSYPGARGYSARAGRAKITLGPDCRGNGHAHPWHLIHVDSSSNVYGWVDEGTFD